MISTARLTSTTARPAEKGATDRQDPALIRRCVDAVVALTGTRRKAARQQVTSWLAGGMAASDIEAWLRANYRLDPTGVTAVRNVDRDRGGRRG